MEGGSSTWSQAAWSLWTQTWYCFPFSALHGTISAAVGKVAPRCCSGICLFSTLVVKGLLWDYGNEVLCLLPQSPMNSFISLRPV